MKKTILATLMALSFECAFALDYYLVVPVQGKTAALSAIDVTLNAYTLPSSIVGVPYSAFNFNSVLQVTGDAAFSSSQVSWAVTGGALPSGLTLNPATGVLTGTPTTAGTSNFQLTATYKTKSGQNSYSISVNMDTVQGSWDLSSEDYGSLFLGEQLSKTYTFTNTGRLPTTGSYLAYANGQFRVTNNTCGSSSSRIILSAGQTCTTTVQFTPSNEGNWTMSLPIYNGSTLLAQKTLTGMALSATGTLTAATSSNFGSVETGKSASLVFSYKVAGNTDSTNVRASVQGADLSISASTCGTESQPRSMSPGDTCSVTVSYQPKVAGALVDAKVIVTADHDRDELALQGVAQAALAANCKRASNGQVWCVGPTNADSGLTVCGYPTGYSGVYYAATATAAAAHGMTIASGGNDCATNYTLNTLNSTQIRATNLSCWTDDARWARTGAPSGTYSRVFVRCVNME